MGDIAPQDRPRRNPLPGAALLIPLRAGGVLRDSAHSGYVTRPFGHNDQALRA